MKVLLDTHAIIWAAEGDDRLGSTAVKNLQACDHLDAAISDLSLYEIAMLADKNRIQLTLSVKEYLEQIKRIYQVVPVSASIASEAVKLALPQGDPFDRIIVASAIYHDLPLITKDRKIQESGLCKVIW